MYQVIDDDDESVLNSEGIGISVFILGEVAVKVVVNLIK